MLRKKKLGSAFLTLIFAVCFVTNTSMATAEVSPETDLDIRNGAEYLENQDASNEAYSRLLNQFETQSLSRNSGAQQYPEYYAGAYIGENGNLVVLTKEAAPQDINTLADVCDNNSITFAVASYSYNELIDIKETIFNRVTIAAEMEEYNDIAVRISIRDMENKVFLGVPDPDDIEFLNYLTAGIDPECYSVYQADELHELASLVPGDYINGDSIGSAAYKAKLIIDGEEKIGFVTAGHVTNGSNIYDNGFHLWGKIGNTIVEQNAGSVDAAFVELTGSNTFNNTVNGYQLEEHTSVIPAPGSRVYKIGNTTGTTSGFVLSNTNETPWIVNGQLVYFSDLVETDVACSAGDSGGLMYTQSGNTYKVVGIIKGGSDTDGKYYATKASYLPWNISIIS